MKYADLERHIGFIESYCQARFVEGNMLHARKQRAWALSSVEYFSKVLDEVAKIKDTGMRHMLIVASRNEMIRRIDDSKAEAKLKQNVAMIIRTMAKSLIRITIVEENKHKKSIDRVEKCPWYQRDMKIFKYVVLEENRMSLVDLDRYKLCLQCCEEKQLAGNRTVDNVVEALRNIVRLKPSLPWENLRREWLFVRSSDDLNRPDAIRDVCLECPYQLEHLVSKDVK